MYSKVREHLLSIAILFILLAQGCTPVQTSMPVIVADGQVVSTQAAVSMTTFAVMPGGAVECPAEVCGRVQ